MKLRSVSTFLDLSCEVGFETSAMVETLPEYTIINERLFYLIIFLGLKLLLGPHGPWADLESNVNVKGMK